MGQYHEILLTILFHESNLLSNRQKWQNQRFVSQLEVLYFSVFVAYNCNPAIGGLGHRDVCGLSVADPRQILRISVRTLPRDAGPL